MINSVTPSSPFAELPADSWPKPAAADAKPPASTPAPAAAPSAEENRDLRLVIEFDKHRNFYVYRLIDRQTGNVINSIPRSEVSKLGESPDYEAGGVVSTSA
jgi:hypothetical protein